MHRAMSAPPPGQVDLWIVDLAAGAHSVAALAETLDDVERARAARLRFEHLRRRFVIRRAAFRDVLARYVGGAPARLRFVSGASGKPSLGFAGLDHNATHSGDLALLAVSNGAPVGVDVEEVRDLGDRYEWLSAEERKLALDGAHEAPAVGALRMWTRKEARLKALGIGVGGLDGTLRLPPSASGDAWTCTDLDPRGGYVGALATPFAQPAIVPRPWRASVMHGSAAHS